ncbi:MAG: 3-oxoacyl-(acyl-carrier-protein) reductase FabG [candidate division WS2 bacterium]|uniref:3-oxoacyl-(Acyl-carrier-protein) reductase FabG n=1 Tax=Psychracetigena formicireducens TaxID=2986056 RepID=A0A9E2BFT4_PSYF1|nr:3-oxoacyl-(acyl-carrier-protein) reductase FabG [Candidatus Psychracetigena formicireducens]
MKKLDGKVCIVTGGAKGIGKEISLLFAKKGAKVVIWDLDLENLNLVKKGLEDKNYEVLTQYVDVTDRNLIKKAVAEIIEKWNRIDVLINNAGITRDGYLAKVTEEDFDLVINVNLKGVFNCTQLILPQMIAQNSGSIICLSSIVGRDGNPGQTNYAASKAGVIGMVKTWGKELARFNIRANAIAPGYTLTEMVQKVPEKILDAIKEKTPLKRLASSEDVAKLALFLASDDSNFITGQVISVDGGLVL